MSHIAILLTDYSEKYAPVHGNFADQAKTLLNNAGNTSEIKVYDAIKSQLPTNEDLKHIKAIWITGSTADSFENDEWILKLIVFIQSLVKDHKDIPLVGICFGHQLISRALGAKVDRNPKGWEFGSYEVNINKDNEEISHLFHDSNKFKILEVHQDIVYNIPNGYTNIGSTEITEIQGLFKKNELLTFQGHPEFENDLVKEFIKAKEENGTLKVEFAQKSLDSLKQGHDGDKLGKVILNFINKD